MLCRLGQHPTAVCPRMCTKHSRVETSNRRVLAEFRFARINRSNFGAAKMAHRERTSWLAPFRFRRACIRKHSIRCDSCRIDTDGYNMLSRGELEHYAARQDADVTARSAAKLMLDGFDFFKVMAAENIPGSSYFFLDASKSKRWLTGCHRTWCRGLWWVACPRNRRCHCLVCRRSRSLGNRWAQNRRY